MESCSNTQSSHAGSNDEQGHDEVRLNPSRIKNHRKNSIVKSTYEPISDSTGSNSIRNSNSSNRNSNSKMSNLLFQNTGCKITHWNSTPLLLISGANFINILCASFLYEILAPKVTKLCFGFEVRPCITLLRPYQNRNK
jgi:hypothetical protein